LFEFLVSPASILSALGKIGVPSWEQSPDSSLMQLIERGKLAPEAIEEALREKDKLNAAFIETGEERTRR
jgi:hypothetical protein